MDAGDLTLCAQFWNLNFLHNVKARVTPGIQIDSPAVLNWPTVLIHEFCHLMVGMLDQQRVDFLGAKVYDADGNPAIGSGYIDAKYLAKEAKDVAQLNPDNYAYFAQCIANWEWDWRNGIAKAW
ncbi:hypothetical protein LTR81_027614 [Elasticomyces elasticus]